MNYVITGAAGHISNPLAKILLKAGHHVTVIGRSKDHLLELINLGATPAIGSVEDAEFLKQAFAGADAVYTMCPPNIHSDGIIDYCEHVGRNYKECIEINNIRYVVNLSSVGAHLEKDGGHILSMSRVEQILNGLTKVNIKHLRPVFFYTNLFAQFDLIKDLGIMGGNFAPDKFAIVHPDDIADVAANELLNLNFREHSIQYIASDETNTDEIAAVIGKAIGKPDLRWIKFTNEQALQGFMQAGFPEKTAKEFVEGFSAMHSGKIMEHYWKHRPSLGKIKLEDFAKTFAEKWKQTSDVPVL